MWFMPLHARKGPFMSQQMVRGYCIVYLGSRDSDSPIEVRVCRTDSIDVAIRTARSMVENMAFAGAGGGRAPVGFVIENPEGDELHRWYCDAR
jgi:hypothetical protein